MKLFRIIFGLFRLPRRLRDALIVVEHLPQRINNLENQMNTIDHQIKSLDSQIKSIEDQNKELLARIENSAFNLNRLKMIEERLDGLDIILEKIELNGPNPETHLKNINPENK